MPRDFLQFPIRLWEKCGTVQEFRRHERRASERHFPRLICWHKEFRGILAGSKRVRSEMDITRLSEGRIPGSIPGGRATDFPS